MTLGDRIRELRQIKDLSLRELATRLKLSAPFVLDIELGRRFPSDKVLAEIAKKLGSSFEELKELDTRPPVEAIKRKAIENPAYGLALRRVIDQNISPEDLMKLADSKRGVRRKK